MSPLTNRSSKSNEEGSGPSIALHPVKLSMMTASANCPTENEAPAVVLHEGPKSLPSNV